MNKTSSQCFSLGALYVWVVNLLHTILKRCELFVLKFQKTALQKAERHNHQSIVQLLLKNNATPSYQQPVRYINYSY